MTTTANAYPRKVADGRGMVWACCESAIGRPCAHQGSVREQALRVAARADVTTSRDRLTMALPGIGTETPDADDVAIVSRIVGYDVRTRATGTYGRPNVALLRASLRRWAVRESCGLRPTDGAA